MDQDGSPKTGKTALLIILLCIFADFVDRSAVFITAEVGSSNGYDPANQVVFMPD
jgi:hypothetical protein